MSDLLQSGQHPDADQLSAFIEHSLPAHEREETLAHLAICPHCRSIVALSLPAAEELPQPHPEPARRPWFSGWKIVWPAGIAVAALALAGIYIRHGVVVEKHVTPVQTAQSAPPVAPEQLQPTAALKLQTPGSAPHPTARYSSAPVPETTSQSQAVDRLRAVPGGGMTAFGASAVAGGAATQSSSITVAGASQGIQTASPAVGLLAANQAQVVPVRHGLPSGLPALSTVANARRVVAIDSHNTLFSSNDAGGHWNFITQPWQGRAVKVELVPASYPASTRNDRVAAAPAAGLVGGTGLHDSVEGPKAILSGAITDPAGASIPNASVVVTNSVTQAVHRAATDSAGRYTVDQLEPGTYTLQAEAPGFTPQQVSGLALNPAQRRQTDLTLALGSMAETVEVQAQGKPVPSAPSVQEKIAVRQAAVPLLLRFEITTDTGEHWTSIDGRSWQRKNE
jgi:Carboxypeptidase regulatory-like domain/Putative zinc-finger